MYRLELATEKDLADYRARQRESETGAITPASEWTRWYEGLSDEKKAKVREELANAPRVGPNEGPQMHAFNSKAQVLGFGGAAGGGKLLSKNEVIQGFAGPLSPMDMEEGMFIPDVFGGVQEVISTWKTDTHPIYRMSFSDGTDIECGPEHLWTCWRSHYGKKARTHADADSSGRVFGPSAARVMRTDRIIREMDHGRRYRVPLAEPAVGNFNRFKIDPYLLGAMIGDGYMPHRQGCRLYGHGDDAQVMLEVAKGVEAGEFTIQPQVNRPHLLVGRLSTLSKAHVQLRDMGMLDKRAWEKELPKGACFAPITWRWSLLQGLMDTDGWVERKRCAYYCTTSPKLRDQVANLARSLGCFVTITNKQPSYTYNEEKLQGRPAYTLRIKSATPEKLFRLERKRAIAAELKHQSLSKEITDIEYLGKDAGACIQVDHPSGLYLTSDYTVTHNSALIALLAILNHTRTVIFRYDSKQLRGLIDDLVTFAGTSEGLNRGHSVFRLPDRPDHVIEWGGLGAPGSELVWQGRPHDLIAFDEVTHLTLERVQFVQTWLRTTDPGQRCRVIMTFNPPGSSTDEGDTGIWVLDYFAPWINERYKGERAEPGEIRYFAMSDGNEDIEVEDDRPRTLLIKGQREVVIPESRTFIPSLLQHNPHLSKDGRYRQKLLARPEPFRSKMLLGDFRSGILDHPRQVIPTAWVEEAIARGKDRRTNADPMDALGVDVARGGAASTVLARRHGWWWDELIRKPGKETPDGHETKGLCLEHVADGAMICIDVGGPGTSPYDLLAKTGVYVKPVNFGQRGDKKIPLHLRRVEYHLPFMNLRAILYWLMRKILDPAMGFDACLPNDNLLRAELIAPRKIEAGGIMRIESKSDIRLRTGLTMDSADAVVASLYNFNETDGAWRLYGGQKVRRVRNTGQHTPPRGQLIARGAAHRSMGRKGRSGWMRI